MKLVLIAIVVAIGVAVFSHFSDRDSEMSEGLSTIQQPPIHDSKLRDKNGDNEIIEGKTTVEFVKESQGMSVSLTSNDDLIAKNLVSLVATDKLENEIYITAPATIQASDFIFEEGVVVDAGFVKTYPMATNKFLKIVYPDDWNPTQKYISIKFQPKFDLLYGYLEEDEALMILPVLIDRDTGHVKFRIHSKQNTIIFGITEK